MDTVNTIKNKNVIKIRKKKLHNKKYKNLFLNEKLYTTLTYY